jgi:hypothetical protein
VCLSGRQWKNGQSQEPPLSSYPQNSFGVRLRETVRVFGIQMREARDRTSAGQRRLQLADWDSQIYVYVGNRISRHHAAAFVIARRGLGFSEERFRTLDHGALRVAASIPARHARFFHQLRSFEWKKVGRLGRSRELALSTSRAPSGHATWRPLKPFRWKKPFDSAARANIEKGDWDAKIQLNRSMP